MQLALPQSVTIAGVGLWRGGQTELADMTVYVKPTMQEKLLVVEMRGAPAKLIKVSLTDEQLGELRQFFAATASLTSSKA
jgi:hypothetical protein